MEASATAIVDIVFRHYVPAKPLSEFVALIWYWRGHDVQYSKERILPMGTAELVINLASTDPAEAGISGPQSESFLIERTTKDELLGIHFNLGGAFPFFDFPFGELHGLNVSLADVWGERRASRLLCLLQEARSVDRKFQVLEQWLMHVVAKPLRHHPAVLFAMSEFQKGPGLFSSATVAAKVNMSQRRFIQLFRDEVGLTPKLFCRVQRFQQVINVVAKRDVVDWTDVALSCGYFDQSHFNHDFREFSGITPTEYFELRTENHSHVQVRD
jgi:AraC-like DNA-binding protein